MGGTTSILFRSMEVKRFERFYVKPCSVNVGEEGDIYYREVEEDKVTDADEVYGRVVWAVTGVSKSGVAMQVCDCSTKKRAEEVMAIFKCHAYGVLGP